MGLGNTRGIFGEVIDDLMADDNASLQRVKVDGALCYSVLFLRILKMFQFSMRESTMT